MFRINDPGALGGDGMTQFGRALHALNIDIICANSSRVERAHKTLQDRLVKELRFVGVRTFAEGNVLLPAFMADYNARFAKPPATAPAAAPDLEDAFAWKEQRRRSQALTLQYDKVLFILEPSEQAKAAIGKYVTVFDYPDGRLAIPHNGGARSKCQRRGSGSHARRSSSSRTRSCGCWPPRRQDDLARRLVDIGDDIGNQSERAEAARACAVVLGAFHAASRSCAKPAKSDSPARQRPRAVTTSRAAALRMPPLAGAPFPSFSRPQGRPTSAARNARSPGLRLARPVAVGCDR